MKRLLPLILTAMLLLCCMSGTALAENKFVFDRTVNTVFENEELPLVLNREGDCADAGDLTFKSSAPRIATVDANGLLTAHQPGNAGSSLLLHAQHGQHKAH